MEVRGTLVIAWGQSSVSIVVLTWLVTIAHPGFWGDLFRIYHHEFGRASLEPRRYTVFLIVPVPRAACGRKRRGARDEQSAGAKISAGLSRLRKNASLLSS